MAIPFLNRISPQYQQVINSLPESVVKALIQQKAESDSGIGLSFNPSLEIPQVLSGIAKNPLQSTEQAYRYSVYRTLSGSSDFTNALSDSSTYLAKNGYDYNKLSTIANEEQKVLIEARQPDQGLVGGLLSGLGL